MSAIQSYLMNEFQVEDAEGIPRYWNELPNIERRRFAMTHFPRAEINSFDEKELRHVYDMRAFGGTPHTEDQRASLKFDNS